MAFKWKRLQKALFLVKKTKKQLICYVLVLGFFSSRSVHGFLRLYSMFYPDNWQPNTSDIRVVMIFTDNLKWKIACEILQIVSVKIWINFCNFYWCEKSYMQSDLFSSPDLNSLNKLQLCRWFFPLFSRNLNSIFNMVRLFILSGINYCALSSF